MKKDYTLLIMAAGMGSRFGGLKQIEKMGENGEFLIDYSIYDAIKVGFNKVVFIIKEESLDLFRETVGKRVEKYIDTAYVFQKIDDVVGLSKKVEREKPWGTAQAIYAARNEIKGDFLIINADDFYGRDAYLTAKNFMDIETDDNTYGMIAYQVGHTLTENGSVKRGVVEVEDTYLKKLTESKIEIVDGKIIAKPLNNQDSFTLEKDSLVAMNMFCFKNNLFKYIEDGFYNFFEENYDNLENSEYLIPDLVEKLIETNKVKVKVFSTTAKWQGMTYREDKDKVVNELKKMIEDGEYPQKLWD